MKKQQFLTALKNAGIPSKLGLAVVKQLGYSFPMDAQYLVELGHNLSDIASHGINGGYSGFIYYTDTNAFFAKNRAAIVALCEEMADGLDNGNAIEMVCLFNCFKGLDATEMRDLVGEVARALYGRPKKKDDYLNVPNALAWFAGEEVARAWADYAYEHKNG